VIHRRLTRVLTALALIAGTRIGARCEAAQGPAAAAPRARTETRTPRPPSSAIAPTPAWRVVYALAYRRMGGAERARGAFEKARELQAAERQ
jgi:hypothetical protein